jgi:hypothetical protein
MPTTLMFYARHVPVLAAAAPSHCALTLAAELQGVQEPGEPTDRHRADQCRLQLVCLYQRRGAGEQQAAVVVRF